MVYSCLFLWNGIRRCLLPKINISIPSDSFGRTTSNQILKNGDGEGKERLIKHFILLHQNCCVEGVVLFYLLYILLVGLNKVPQKKTLRKN